MNGKHLIRRIFNGLLMLALIAGLLSTAVQPASAANGGSISIVSVRAGESVTIQAQGFTAYREFRVLMNTIGTKGINGIVAGSVSTDREGGFVETFKIPRELQDNNRIAIRIESTQYSWAYAYNWFENRTYSSSSGNSGRPSGGSNSGGAVLDILKVVEDKSVRFEARRLPVDARFRVWLEWENRHGEVKSYQMGSLYSNGRGTINKTIDIPRELRDRSVLTLRLEAVSTRVVVRSWFLNASSEDGVGAGAPDGFEDGVPVLKVTAAVRNDTVTITASNLPARMEFAVLLGRVGSEGIDGIEVDTFRTDRRGRFSGTFDIPRKLWDRDRIAIRIESVDDGGDYYAFNWFTNQTSQ